jgi:anti-sigma regulatory factor (Ser/Thr protein kinase)
VADDSELDVVASLTMTARSDAARRARKFLTDFCRAAQLPPDLCQTAALLVSELVTNAVVHGRTSATVEVHRPADTLRVTVRDDNPALPAVGDAPDFTDEHGRGLLIVSKLARRWGVEASGDGKAVWFELAVR